MKLAIVGIVFAVFDEYLVQLFIKSSIRFSPIPFLKGFNGLPSNTIYFIALLVIGLILYFISMSAWLFTLQIFPLNYAYPILSLSYVIVYVLAAYWSTIEEPYTLQRTIDIITISIGVLVCTSSRNKGFTA